MADEPDKDPELAANEHWRGIMIRARKAHGLSQEQLGARVGVSQTVISKLEGGDQTASNRILAICRVLSIPAPQHFTDEDALAWSELGHVLRAGNDEQYRAARAMVEAMVKALPPLPKATEQATDADTEQPRNRK